MRGVANPQTDEDGVNLRTLQASATSVLEQATAAANTAVSDAITNHANILNRDIRKFNLFSVDVHEIGHCIGPFHNTEDKDSNIIYKPGFSVENKNNILSESDIKTVHEMYGAAKHVIVTAIFNSDSALPRKIDSFFWLSFCLMNSQESLVISIVVFLEAGLNF